MTGPLTITGRRPGLPAVEHCSRCQAEPRTPSEYLDLATQWLLPAASGAALVVRRFCRGCAPSGPVAEVVCRRCGDGPLLAGALAVMDLPVTAAVDAWLEREGWRTAEPWCPDCVGESAP